MNIEYLFLPEEVEEILKNYPELKKLTSPFKEGVESSGFHKARKSQRQIYRILTNQHDDHLAELLKTLEFCLSKGFQNPALLQTRDSSQFSSAVSELFVGEAFIDRGFQVRGFDHAKEQQSVPDIIATSHECSLVAEIYSPRDWEGLALFVDEIRLYLKYLDRPLDFIFHLRNNLIELFDSNHALLTFDPWDFSAAMENKQFREQSVQNIIEFIDDNLSTRSAGKIEESFNFERFNVKSSLEIKDIQISQNDYPDRCGSTSPPTLSGYAPEGMFDHLLKRRILNKLRKKQTHTVSGNHIRALIVDISHLGYQTEFDHSVYQNLFKKSLQTRLGGQHIHADFILFCTPRAKNRGGLIKNFVFLSKDMSVEDLHPILGDIPDEIIVR